MFGVEPTPDIADAQIGSVTIGGDWIASGLVAGADGNGDGFGDIDDFKITGVGTTDSVSIVSKIASITIKGQAHGSPNSVNATDLYGIIAQQIGSLTVGRRKFVFHAGPANENIGQAIGLTGGDLRLNEVSL